MFSHACFIRHLPERSVVFLVCYLDTECSSLSEFNSTIVYTFIFRAPRLVHLWMDDEAVNCTFATSALFACSATLRFFKHPSNLERKSFSELRLCIRAIAVPSAIKLTNNTFYLLYLTAAITSNKVVSRTEGKNKHVVTYEQESLFPR